MINWMQFKIRSRWLKANLQLLTLLALSRRPMSTWELMDEIYSTCGMMPEETQVKRTIQTLVDDGFVQIPGDELESRMHINALGLELLSKLEAVMDEYIGLIETPPP